MKVSIQELVIEMIIGLYDWERLAPQKVAVNITYEYTPSEALLADSLDGAIDYSALCEDIRTFSQSLEPQILERYVLSLRDHLLTNYPMTKVTVSATKPHAIPATKGITATVEGEHVPVS